MSNSIHKTDSFKSYSYVVSCITYKRESFITVSFNLTTHLLHNKFYFQHKHILTITITGIHHIEYLDCWYALMKVDKRNWTANIHHFETVNISKHDITGNCLISHFRSNMCKLRERSLNKCLKMYKLLPLLNNRSATIIYWNIIMYPS